MIKILLTVLYDKKIYLLGSGFIIYNFCFVVLLNELKVSRLYPLILHGCKNNYMGGRYVYFSCVDKKTILWVDLILWLVESIKYLNVVGPVL